MYHNTLLFLHEIRLCYRELNTVSTKPLLGNANVICLAKQIFEITAIFVNWSALWGWPVIPTVILMELNTSLYRSFHQKLETMAKTSRSARLDQHKLEFLTNPQANPVSLWLLALLSDPAPWKLWELQPHEYSGHKRARLWKAMLFQLIQYLQKPKIIWKFKVKISSCNQYLLSNTNKRLKDRTWVTMWN